MISDKKILDRLVIIKDKRMLISYKGPVTPEVMATITTDIQQKITDNSKTCRRVMSVFIELVQNILYYSVEKIEYAGRTESVGMLQIIDMNSYYLFTCGNTITKAGTYSLLNTCSIINNMNKLELRKLKRQHRQQPVGKDSKGAGFGLVQVAILSGYPLDIYIHDVNSEYSFYTLGVRINK